MIEERGAELLKDGIVCKEPSIPINNMKDYARYMIYHLHEHVDTEFVLTVQHDGFIINPLAWTDEFFDYDYVEHHGHGESKDLLLPLVSISQLVMVGSH